MRPLLIVLAFVVAQSLSYEIKATGGGIVKVGQDLELSLIVDKVWDRCRWFVYEHHKDFATCSYDLDPDTGKAEQHRCKPENTSDIMTYSGEDPKACTITVANVTEDYDCQWAARLDEDLANTIINVTVAKAIESISLEMERMVVGKEGIVKCKVQGGRPAPMINFSIEKPSPDLSNNVMTQEPDDNGVYTSVQQVMLKPTIGDHGKVVTCEAFIMDGEQNLLFDKSAATTKLNVEFAPQIVDNQTLAADVKTNLTVLFKIKANPAPDNITWTIVTPATEANNQSETLDLQPGFMDDKYQVLEAENVDAVSKAYTLIISDLSEEDHFKDYVLTLENSIGTQTFYFDVNINGVDPGNNGGGNDPENGVPKKNMKLAILVVVVVMIAISILCVVSIIVYKKKQLHNETTPLSILEGSKRST